MSLWIQCGNMWPVYYSLFIWFLFWTELFLVWLLRSGSFLPGHDRVRVYFQCCVQNCTFQQEASQTRLRNPSVVFIGYTPFQQPIDGCKYGGTGSVYFMNVIVYTVYTVLSQCTKQNMIKVLWRNNKDDHNSSHPFPWSFIGVSLLSWLLRTTNIETCLFLLFTNRPCY